MSSPIGTPEHISESSQLPQPTQIKEAGAPKAKIVHVNYGIEQPDSTSFEKLIHFHDRTPQLQIAVSSYSELITGTDMSVSCESEEATKVLEDWIRETDFYTKFESIVTTTLICGNALMEKLDENSIDDVLEVDMTTIVGKKRDQYGMLQYYEQRNKYGQDTHLGEGSLGKFIEFNLTSYSRQPWGRSLFHSLAIPRTVGNRTTPPLVEIMWGIEDAMGAMLLNNAYPVTTITYPGVSDEYLEKEATRWQRYKPGDKRVQKVKPDIEFFETSAGSKYTDYVAHLEKTFELGTQFPHDIMTGDFTSRASSETTDNIVMKRVRGYQRYLGNKLKTELFDNILAQKGFDPNRENCKVSFTAQNVIELEVAQVKDLTTQGVMSKSEAREWLRVNTGMELPDDETIVAQDKLKAELQDKANKIKQDALKQNNDAIESVRQVAAVKGRVCKMCKESQHAFCSKRGCRCKHV